jgi:hypothetical protein
MCYSLYSPIEEIRECPGLYLGCSSITLLECFLHGYDYALYKNRPKEVESLFPLPFSLFDDFVMNYYGCNWSTAGWRNIILHQANNDEEKGLAVFFELFDKFSSLKVDGCKIAKLNNANTELNSGFENMPKITGKSDAQRQEYLLYRELGDIFRIKLSDEAGYIVLLNTSLKCILHRRIFVNQCQADMSLRGYIGCLPAWGNAPNGMNQINKRIVVDFIMEP